MLHVLLAVVAIIVNGFWILKRCITVLPKRKRKRENNNDEQSKSTYDLLVENTDKDLEALDKELEELEKEDNSNQKTVKVQDLKDVRLIAKTGGVVVVVEKT